MRVLELQEHDSRGGKLRHLCQKEGIVHSAGELRERQQYRHNRNNAHHHHHHYDTISGGYDSVASSLNYSTDDGESYLEGSQLLQTISG